MKKLHIILLLLFFTQSHSQQDSIAKAEYITSFPDKISARLSLLYTGNSFFTVDKNNNELELTPSELGYLSASLLFRSIEIG